MNPTTSMPLDSRALSVLLAVYELSAETRPAHLGSLAARLGLARSEAVQALRDLDGAGLIWAARCRLTLRGLTLAAQLSSRRARARRAA